MEVQNKGYVIFDIFKHLSPLTISTLLNNLPIKARVNRYKDSFIFILTDIVAGSEKAKLEFNKGDIAFLTYNGSICIFLKDIKLDRPMNPLGRVSEGLNIVENLNSGDSVTLKLLQEAV